MSGLMSDLAVPTIFQVGLLQRLQMIAELSLSFGPRTNKNENLPKSFTKSCAVDFVIARVFGRGQRITNWNSKGPRAFKLNCLRRRLSFYADIIGRFLPNCELALFFLQLPSFPLLTFR
jgi:hypothetical protein